MPIRQFSAPRIRKIVRSWPGVRVERIECALSDQAASLHVRLPEHAIYYEMSRGFQCSRKVAGHPRVEFVSRPGMVSFRPAGSETTGSTRGNGHLTYAAIFVDPHRIFSAEDHDLLPRDWRPATASTHPALVQEAIALVEHCTADNAPDDRLAALYAQSHAASLLITLATLQAPSPARVTAVSPRKLQRAQVFIASRLDTTPSLAQIAEAARLSVSQTIRLFRASTGMTPGTYVARLKIQEAARRLADSSSSIAQVADALGYNSQSHFARQFRRHLGTTPSEYRKTHKEIPR
ncbi:MAG: AraC family transcriptional regulator [Burkholderiaceae bacterium]